MWWFAWVRDKDLLDPDQPGYLSVNKRILYLKDMESLKLDILALAFEQIQHDLQVLLRRDVARHDAEVRSVQQDFA